MKLIDITGMKYGRLTVLAKAQNKGKKVYWECICDCGNNVVVESYKLRTGSTSSCGCYKRESSSENGKKNIKHGCEGTRLYHIWQMMKQRCFNPRKDNFDRYGGRGITVCDEWRDDFVCFRDWALDNGYSDGLTLDRIDNDGNYEPSNCRWATVKEQANNRSSNHIITYMGVTGTVTEICEKFGLNRDNIYSKLRR